MDLREWRDLMKRDYSRLYDLSSAESIVFSWYDRYNQDILEIYNIKDEIEKITTSIQYLLIHIKEIIVLKNEILQKRGNKGYVTGQPMKAITAFTFLSNLVDKFLETMRQDLLYLYQLKAIIKPDK